MRFPFILFLSVALFVMGFTVFSVSATSSIFYSESPDGYLVYSGAENVTYADVRAAVNATLVDADSDAVDVGQDFHESPTYDVLRGVLFFDTSSIPDDNTIISGYISLWGDADSSTKDFNLVIQSSVAAGFPHSPLVSSDYNMTNYDGNYGVVFNTVDWVLGSYNVIDLSDFSFISLDNYTYVVIRSGDDVAGVEPDSMDTVRFSANESDHPPILYLSYRLVSSTSSSSSTTTVTSNICVTSTTFTSTVFSTTSCSTVVSSSNSSSCVTSSEFSSSTTSTVTCSSLSSSIVSTVSSSVGDLQLNYPFNDEADPTEDKSGNNYDGNIAGGSFSDGVHGKALDFDTNTWVDAGTASNTHHATDLTVCGWFKFSNHDTAQQIVSRWTWSTGDYRSWMFQNVGSGKIRLAGSSDGADSGYWSAATSNDFIPDNDWHFLAVTYDGATVKFYLDGDASVDVAVSNTFYDATGFAHTSVGCQDIPYLGDSFVGSMDDVMIFTEHLSATQLSAIRLDTPIGDESHNILLTSLTTIVSTVVSTVTNFSTTTLTSVLSTYSLFYTTTCSTLVDVSSSFITSTLFSTFTSSSSSSVVSGGGLDFPIMPVFVAIILCVTVVVVLGGKR